VTAGAQVPDSETGPIFVAQFEKRSADIAAFPIAAVPEAPVPDDATAQRWYDNHPDQYATPEYRRVKLIVLSPATLAPDITVTDKDVQAAYDLHKADYTTIARRSAEVISTTDEAKAAALADQWRAGADWTAMEAAAKAVFSAPPDTFPTPIKGALGWFVIRVTKATEGGVEPFDQVKDKLRQRVTTEKALELVYDKANKLDGELGNGAALDAPPPEPGVVAATATLDQLGDSPEGPPAAL